MCGARRRGDAGVSLQRQPARAAGNDHFRLVPIRAHFKHGLNKHCFNKHGLNKHCFNNHGGAAARPDGPELSVHTAAAYAELSRSRTVTHCP